MQTDIRSLHDKQLFVFDLDGTVYLGDVPFPPAVRLIHLLRQAGRRILFFTNNTSRAKSDYIRRLSDMGFDPRADEILTAGDVTIAALQDERPGARVFLLGTPALSESFRAAGIALSDGTPGSCDVAVSAFDTTLTYEKVLRFCRLVDAGAAFWTTHPDRNCPSPDGIMPDCGAINAMITASTGVQPRCLGKPEATVTAAIERLCGVPRAQMCMFGDRLYTDIALANRSGVLSVLVLTGETDCAMLRAAPSALQPALVLPSCAPACELFER